MTKNLLTLCKPVAMLLIVAMATLVASCGSDEPEAPKFNNASLSCSQDYTIPGGENLTWTSDNEFIATVKGNIVTAHCIGETSIRSQKGSFKVTVFGTTKVFTEPCILWGASQAAVKSATTGYDLSSQSTSKELYYTSAANKRVLYYKFENGLSSTILMMNAQYVNSDKLLTQLSEYYVPVTVNADDGYVGFITIDKKTLVVFTIETSGSSIIYAVIYAPYNASKSSSRSFETDAAQVVKDIAKQRLPAIM